MSTATASRLDKIYRKMLITRFFEKGWGKAENLRRLFEFRKFVSNRDTCYNLIPRDYPVQITREEKTSDALLIDGEFLSPMELFLPGVVPPESRKSYFQLVLPLKWENEKYKPMCVHFAGTGDHFFWRRRNFLAKPLLREGGIGAILLENPFYGLRKPKEQTRSNLQHVSDIFVMGGSLILESLVLFHFCERNGLGPLGVSGLSMGGHMASLAATNWPKPLVLVPCLSWSTAAAVFTQGVMSESINWCELESQFFSSSVFRKKLAKMVNVVDGQDEAFMAGRRFVKNYDNTNENLDNDLKAIATNISYQSDILSVSSNASDRISEIYRKIEELNTQGQLLNVNDSAADDDDDSAHDEMTRLKLDPIDTTKIKWWEREALQFMRGMMDECTHLKNFSVPYDTSLITAVCAKDDAYVPRDGCSSLEDIWPGAEIKYLDAGHVSAYVLYQKLIRSSIIERFEKAKEKYQYYRKPIPPDTTMPTLQKRWRSSISIKAIQSVQNQRSAADDEADKLATSNAN
ncbi:protein ABHD18 [Contarinia nasturtii]|uniref:protein ABHD18 n=1 Tax=Contarinia nasturtii TaxID=265458 RepID=UPI0012D41211|nr:protein ABHD18 [Contarinia nasturtii]